MMDTKESTEFAVNLNIRAMNIAARNGHWMEVTNAARLIEAMLRRYETLLGAVRIE